MGVFRQWSTRLALCGIVGGLVAGSSTVLRADDGEIRLRAQLRGPAIRGLVPSGHADFRDRPGERRFSTEVEDVNLPAGTRLTVLANGTVVGTIVLGPPPVRGGDLNLDTRDGDFVPLLSAGQVVTVKAGATTILSGTLRPD